MKRADWLEELEGRRMLSGGGTEANPVGDDQTWVTSVYQQVLHRGPDAGGMQGWVGELQSGVSRTDVARVILDSHEHHEGEVQDMYEHLLGRDPEAEARDSAAQFLDDGGHQRDIEETITSSDEYYARQGGTNSQYVDALYEDVLGRPADDAGKAGFVGALNAGASRSAVTTAITQSPESAEHRVRELYQEHLHRSGDDAGVDGFSQELEHGGRVEDVEADMLGSGEYSEDARHGM